jgi:hypothetical protein
MFHVGRAGAAFLVSTLLVGCQPGGSRAEQAESAAADSAAAAAATARAEEASKTLKVTHAMIGKRVGEGNRVTEPTFQFAPSETVYVSVGTVGSPDSAVLAARWTNQKGEVVDSSARTIQPKGRDNTALQAARAKGWTPGAYRVTIYANGDSVDSKTFAVAK